MARDCLPNGTIVGGYEIIKPLSEGGSCLVYSVKNKEGKYFVLKEYYPKRWNRTEKEFETDFIREGLILKSKKETRIEKMNAVFDSEIKFLNEISFAEYNGKINNELGAFRAYKVTELEECFAGTLAQYMIIETAAGEPLGKHFEKKDWTSEYIKSVSEFIIKTLYHLRQIHNKGILHIDITPNNIFVSRIHEAEYLPIIIDFGSAVNATKNENGLLIAESTCDVHTKSEGFSAPEITLALNAPETTVITAQADIYSIGAIIYKLLTDESFSTEKIYEWNIDGFVNLESYLFDKISEKFKDILPGVIIKLVNILTRCLEKEPNKRYKNCDELIAELKSLVEIIDSKGFHPEVIFDKASDCASKFKGEIEQEILADVSAEKEEPKIFKNINGNSALTDAYKAFCYEKENRNAIVVSEGGAGKTYACRNSVCQFLREYIETNGESPIPLYIPAFKVETNIKAYINTNFIGSTDEQIEKGLSELFEKKSSTKLIIFIDGFNEISDSEQKEKIINEINGLIEEYPQISFIVTTRNEYDEGRIAKTETFSLLKLSEETVEKYVGHNVEDEIKEIIRNPLLLTVYVKTGSDIYKYADKQGYSILTAPGKETVTTAGELLWNFNQSHIVKLGGEYDRDSTSVLEAEDVLKIQYALEVILPAVAYLMVTNGKYSLSFKELKKYIETGTTQLQSFDGLDEFEEIAIPAKWMLKSLSNFGLIIYDKKEHSYKNIRIYHETILNFYCALHLRNLLKYDSDAAYKEFSRFAFSDETLRILGEICGNQYFKFENKNGNAETAGFEPIKIYSFEKKDYQGQKDSLIGSLIEKCRNRFDNAGAECVRNLITAVEFSAKEICGWDLSYLDFSKSYLERTKLSNYDSYSVFDYSNFSRETFEGITREEFEGQNWVYNEETDTFIGETLQANAKTGWVERIEKDDESCNKPKNDDNETLSFSMVEDNSDYTKFSISDNITGNESFLFFSKVDGLFYNDLNQLPLERKQLGNFSLEDYNGMDETVVSIKKRLAKMKVEGLVKENKAIPSYHISWKQYGNFLFACITRIFKGSTKEYFISVDMKTLVISNFKVSSDVKKYRLFNSFDFNGELTGIFDNAYSFCNLSADGFPTIVTINKPTNTKRCLVDGFCEYDSENEIGTMRVEFYIADFKNHCIKTTTFIDRMKSKTSSLFSHFCFLKNSNLVLLWFYSFSKHKMVIYDYINNKVVNDFSLESHKLPHLVYQHKEYLYMIAEHNRIGSIYAIKMNASGFFDIKAQRALKGINYKFLCSSEASIIIDHSKVNRFSLDLEEEKNETKLLNVNSFYEPKEQDSGIVNNHLVVNCGRNFSVCSLSSWTQLIKGRDGYNNVINRTKNFNERIIGFSTKNNTVSLLTDEPLYSERIKKKIDGETQPLLLGFLTKITTRSNNESKNKCVIHSETKLSQYVRSEKYEYFLFPGDKLQISQKSTHMKCAEIPIEDKQVKIASDEIGIYIWKNKKQEIEVWSTDGKYLIKTVNIRDVMLVDNDAICENLKVSSDQIDINTYNDSFKKNCKASRWDILNDYDFEHSLFEAYMGNVFILLHESRQPYYVSFMFSCSIYDEENLPTLTRVSDKTECFLWHFKNDEHVFEVCVIKGKIVTTNLMDLSFKSYDIQPTENIFIHFENIAVLKTQIPGKYRVLNLDPKDFGTMEYIYINPIDVFGCSFKEAQGIPEETKNRMRQYGAKF